MSAARRLDRANAGGAKAEAPAAARRRSAPEPSGGIAAIQRQRLLSAAALAARDRGAAGVSVADIVARSGVSRRTFYEIFSSGQECVLAVVEEVIARVTERVRSACAAQGRWNDAARDGLAAFLAFLDEEPVLGAFLVIDSLGAGDAALVLRGQALRAAVDAMDAGRRHAGERRQVSRLTAEGVVGAVLSIVHARLLERVAVDSMQGSANSTPGSANSTPGSADSTPGSADSTRRSADSTKRSTDSTPRSMTSLLGQLMAIIVLPYLGPAAAAREARRSPLSAPAPIEQRMSTDSLRAAGIRVTYRTVTVLRAIAAHPGASSREISHHAGVSDQGQISKLLARLAGAGLIESQNGQPTLGEPYAWRLTERGAQLEHAVRARDGR